MDAEPMITGLTMGEAAVLVGQLFAVPAEHVGGWTLVMQPRGTFDVAIMSSANCEEHGYQRAEMIRMLLDAVQQVVNEMDGQ